MTDFVLDKKLDVETNEIVSDVIEKPIIRKKRDIIGEKVGSVDANSTKVDNISKRSDVIKNNDEEMEYFEYEESVPNYGDERGQEDSERGKRQVRYYLKNGYKTPGKPWAISKPIKLVDLRQVNYQNLQNTRHYQNYNGAIGSHVNSNPYSSDGNTGPAANSYQVYQIDDSQPNLPFKPSLRDPSQNKHHNTANLATQIITKSPPISALRNNENPFASLAGGFYNNAPKQNINQNNNHFASQFASFAERPSHSIVFPDSSQVSSTIITGKPILMSTTVRASNKYRGNSQNSEQSQILKHPNGNLKVKQKPVGSEIQNQDYDDDNESSQEESSENNSSEKEEADDFKHNFPEPPYEFTHPSHRFRDIENPFANPNFDFDAFLAKLSGGQYAVITTEKPKPNLKAQKSALKTLSPLVELTTSSNPSSGYRSSTLNYKGMSTPKPFSGPEEVDITSKPNEGQYIPSSTKQSFMIEQWSPRPTLKQHNIGLEQETSINQNIYKLSQQNAGIPFDAVRPKLKPPNFKDERQLPINYSFNRPIDSAKKQNYDTSHLKNNQQIFEVTQRPYIVVTGTGAPALLSTPKQSYLVKPEKIVALHPQLGTGKPYLVSSVKPHNTYIAFKSTPKPLTTIANEQLAALQNYWKKPTSESYFSIVSTPRPTSISEMPKLENLFSYTLRPSEKPTTGQNIFISKGPVNTTKAPAKRRPIPKPSPEMNDYYYDDTEEDEQYYYEPPVKSKYMPSSEVKPQRPPMAQNYKEYDDSSEEENSRRPVNITPPPRRPVKTSRRPETVTKNYNDVSVETKSPLKNFNKNVNGKIPIPVLVNYATPTSTVLIRPEVSNYEIMHPHRNRTMHIRKPTPSESGPYTLRPPKYLNQTTLRPYTVRHRLAKPTTVSDSISSNDDNKQARGRIRHQNIVAQMKHTTPRDNHNQETRYTKTKHDDKTNR